MSQHDRGAYTPQTDAPLAFDARPPRGGGRPLPMALIASGLVLLVMVVAVVMYYRSGIRPAGAAPQVVGEPVVAMRTPPAADAQPTDPAAGLDVYASQDTAGEPTFAPGLEQPAPRPAPQAGLQVQTVDPSPVNPVPQAQAPRAVAAAPAAPAAVAGGAMVQIGAYSTSALADRGYGEIAAAFPGHMAGKAKRIEPLSVDGRTLYRGLVSGFADRAAAETFCDTLKASGRTCLVRG